MDEHSLFFHGSGLSPALWDCVPDEVVPARARTQVAFSAFAADAPTRDAARIDADRALASAPDGAPLHLYGHSYGAVVALELYALAPGRVRSLWLYEPVMFGALLREDTARCAELTADATLRAGIDEARALLDDHGFLLDPACAGSDPWFEAFIDYWNGPGAWARVRPAMRARFREFAPRVFAEVCGVFLDERGFDRYGELPRLTLVHGERTTAAARAMTRRLSELYATATLDVIDGATHMGPATHADAIVASITRHVSRG